MSTLPMMYVYFDEKGEMKAISPQLSSLDEGMHVASILLSEVEGFITGKKNTTEYSVRTIKNGGNTYHKITKKVPPVISHIRSLDNFLTEIHTMPRSKDAYVLIENNLKEKTIIIRLGGLIKILAAEGTDEEQEQIRLFSSHLSTTLYFTEEGNPYSLLYTLEFSPQKLFLSEELHFSYNIDLSKTSVYTKRLLDRYSYKKV